MEMIPRSQLAALASTIRGLVAHRLAPGLAGAMSEIERDRALKRSLSGVVLGCRGRVDSFRVQGAGAKK